MSAEEFRPIFERFRDLNLIVLAEDLRRGLVAVRKWWDGDLGNGPMTLCPLAHAAECLIRNPATALADICDFATQQTFVVWWDVGGDDRRVALLELCESIIAARLADADAVQAVLTQETMTEVLV